MMRCSVSDLDGMARFLAGLFYPFAVKSPPELREALERHAAELTRLAERSGEEVSSCSKSLCEKLIPAPIYAPSG